jgi:hypothetical protein
MPVTVLNEVRIPIECKNLDCGVVHLYLVSDLAPNYSIRCIDCRVILRRTNGPMQSMRQSNTTRQ